MILFVHMLLGAAIGQKVSNIFLAAFLALFGHYVIDIIPHVEYDIQSLREKQWQKKLIAIYKVVLDFCLGLLFISALSTNKPIIYICTFLAILPDGLSILSDIFPNKLFTFHDYLHQKRIHFLKYKKISNFWRILSQVVVVALSILLFKV